MADSEQRLHAHTESAVKRCDPGIQVLARKYNKLVDNIITHIDQHKAPRKAV